MGLAHSYALSGDRAKAKAVYNDFLTSPWKDADPDIRAKLLAAMDNLADRERCRELLEEGALVRDSIDESKVPGMEGNI